jgi:curved DNA-binding protein CbpA
MSKVQIDFNNIKYNLYEILNVKPDADPVKIKKNFLRIIKNFHPDKNSELEEEIYNHIILANQILLDKEYRTKYDEYINDTAETFQELKNVFNKSVKDINTYFPPKDNSIHLFNSKKEELNNKHGYNEDNTSESVLDKFNKIKEKRDSIETQVDKEDFKTVEEFNKKFTVNKLEGGKFYEQIVEYKGVPQELSTYIIGEQYTSLQDIDKLYIEDSIQSSKYSSLDRAFILQPNNINESVLDKFNKIKEYKDQTDYYKKRTPVDYSKKKFDEW